MNEQPYCIARLEILPRPSIAGQSNGYAASRTFVTIDGHRAIEHEVWPPVSFRVIVELTPNVRAMLSDFFSDTQERQWHGFSMLTKLIDRALREPIRPIADRFEDSIE